MEASKENPAPLDAYETAKPDEPIFVLQGGDPLAAPLVRIWAYLTRVRAGLSGDATMIDAPIYVAKTTAVDHDKAASRDLLVRATAAEQVSWYMDGYRRGEINLAAEVHEQAALDKLDIHDIRRKCASTISSFRAELNDFRLELIDRDWLEQNNELDNAMQGTILALHSIMEKVEIKRGNV